MRVTSTARKDGRWWVVQCVEYPGALSQVRRLEQAAEHQREAVAFVAGVDEADVEVDVVPDIDYATTQLLLDANAQRKHAEDLAASAAEGFRKVAAALQAQGLSMRDIGFVMGVSFQRAGQLLNG